MNRLSPLDIFKLISSALPGQVATKVSFAQPYTYPQANRPNQRIIRKRARWARGL